MRIMIADDHPLYVEGLTSLLSNDFEIVGSARNGLEAIEQARVLKPDMILMDISMPVINGIDATSQIVTEQPQIKIIILISFEETGNLFRAIKAGAIGYLLKNLEGAEIRAGLLEIDRGKMSLSACHEAHILREFETQQLKQQPGAGKDKLSERQLEVLELVARGLGYAEVGKKMFISERTVKFHMAKIKEALQLSSQKQVIAWAWEHGIGRLGQD